MTDTGNFNVKDVRVCACDQTQMDILEIYAYKPPHYAVYRTATRVTIKFSDNSESADEEKVQRAAISKLNPLRGDITSLIDGWRLREVCQKVPDRGCDEKQPVKQYVQPAGLFTWLAWTGVTPSNRRADRLAAKAKRYDRSVADALVLALENDFDGAYAQLQATKDEIIAERTSRARFEYLIWAFTGCVALAVLCWVGWKIFLCIHPKDAYGFSAFMLLAAAAGGVGAFFSVAIAIRSRTVLTDLRSRDNTQDALLRIAIGAIGAAFFVAALRLKLAVLTFGALSTNLISDKSPDWLAILVAAFVAGFSERLVPDLLAKASANTDAAAPAPKKPAPPAPPAAPAGQPGPKATGDDDHKEGCPEDGAAPSGQETPDSELPPARGGVATN